MCWRRCVRRGWRGFRRRVIRASVASFKAVEHRLEFVRKFNGVEFYNDSKATNVDATMKAVASFAGRNSPDSWGEGQGLGLRDDGGSAEGAGEGCLYDWFSGGKD